MDCRWYALYVRPHAERMVSESLRLKGYEEFVPYYRARRRWSDRVKEVEFPLFPGYVFCRFDPQKRLPILQTPGVVHIVSFGKELAPVDDEELEAIRRIVGSNRVVEPWPFLRVGQRVRLVGGSLDGLEGFLVELKKNRRLVVSVTLLQRSVAVTLDQERVEPVWGAPPVGSVEGLAGRWSSSADRHTL